MLPLAIHSHEHGEDDFWADFLSVALDPAHILAEAVFTIVFDGLFIYLGYQILFKRLILPRLRREIHEELDEEHGIIHDENTGKACRRSHKPKHKHKPIPNQGTGTEIGTDNEPPEEL